MHMHKRAAAAITCAFLILGGLPAATAAPAGILAPSAATSQATDADIVKVRRGSYRGRHRFRLHRGGFGRFYGFRRHRYYRRPFRRRKVRRPLRHPGHTVQILWSVRWCGASASR